MKKRYLVGLTETQINFIFNSIKLAEMDLCGGGTYDEPDSAQTIRGAAKLRDNIHNALNEARDNGLKTIK